MLTPGEILMAPAGTPYDGTADKWESLGFVSTDGLTIAAEPDGDTWPDENQQIRSWADAAHRTERTITHTFHFQASKAGHRRMFGLWTGVYRLPGDRPLIHKGKKP